MLVGTLAVELVGWKHGEYSLLRTEVLPLDARVGLQVVCQYCKMDGLRGRGREAIDRGGLISMTYSSAMGSST